MEEQHADVGVEHQDATSTRPQGTLSERTAPPSPSTRGMLGNLGARLSRLRAYPELPPAPRGPLARTAIAVVALMAVAFAAFYIVDVSLLHAAYGTHAEDLGIYDQAMWNALHPAGGHFFHQTICSNVGDTNCLGDVVRTAIHFEPILLLVAPFYALFTSPLTLVAIQAIVVAAGAFPAYWLAARRLGSPLAGVVFAALYLAYPALQGALGSDFHAVTLSATFIMFALYFMLSRNDLGLWIACVLAMTTKEEIPLLVAMIGLSVALLQRRWRLGLSLFAAAVAYFGLAEVVLHLSSPLGHSPTMSRYAYLGGSPLKAIVFVLKHPTVVVRQYLLGPGRITYLRKLLSPTGYLALLSPWALLIAGPELAINMLSTDPTMYSGIYQYNAAIVPVLIFAAIETAAWLGAVAAWLAARSLGQDARAFLAGSAPADLAADVLPNRGASVDGADVGTGAFPAGQPARGWKASLISLREAVRTVWAARSGQHATANGNGSRSSPSPQLATRQVVRTISYGVTALAVLLALGLGAREARTRDLTPLAWGFHWPQVTEHDYIAGQLSALIPASASLSAQSDLAPHLSERHEIYMFPDHAQTADYVFLDVTGNIFPLQDNPGHYLAAVQGMLSSGQYHIVAAQDGYLLLKRGPGASPPAAAGDPYGLPDSFYSFTRLFHPYGSATTAPSHPLDVRFGPSLQLIGYDLSPASDANLNIVPMYITTYWRVTAPVALGTFPQLVLFPPGAQPIIVSDLPATQWLSPTRWQVGQIVVVASRALLPATGAGSLGIGARAVRSGASPDAPAVPVQADIASARAGLSIDSTTGAAVFAAEQVIP